MSFSCGNIISFVRYQKLLFSIFSCVKDHKCQSGAMFVYHTFTQKCATLRRQLFELKQINYKKLFARFLCCKMKAH